MKSPETGENLDANQDSLHQQIEEARQTIREYEESIRAIEKGEKTKVLSKEESNIDNFHGKIVEAEEKLRDLEKRKKEKKPKEESLPELADRIKGVQSIGELFELLRGIDGIKGAGKFFTGEQLVQIIQDVLDGKLEPSEITRSEGLRSKVGELVKKSKKEEKPKKESKKKETKEVDKGADLAEDNVENKEANPSLAEQFASAQSIDEIIEILEGVDNIKTLVGTEVSGESLINMIRKVETGDMPIVGLTNAEGLRDKVKELLNPKVESQEAESNLAEKIKEVQSIDELLDLLKNIEGIQGMASYFTSEDLIKIINAIVNDGLPRSALTNAEGLRDKVEELLGPEPEKVKENSEASEEDFEDEEENENEDEESDEDNEDDEEVPEEDLDPDFEQGVHLREPNMPPPLPTPEQLENIENARLSLEEAREKYVKEHHEYLENRRKSSFLNRIKFIIVEIIYFLHETISYS